MRQPVKARTPEDRAAQIVSRQRSRIRRKYKVNAKKNRKRFPGEIDYKQDMAIILSLAGYNHKEIALSLGEHRNLIGEWMKDPKVVDKFMALSEDLPDSARKLLETYSIEAVHTLVDIMRTSEDDKMILDAAKEILDRGGIPKTSRTESKQEKRETFEISDDDFLSKIRQLPPEKQEEAAQMVENLSEWLTEQSPKSEETNGVTEAQQS